MPTPDWNQPPADSESSSEAAPPSGRESASGQEWALRNLDEFTRGGLGAEEANRLEELMRNDELLRDENQFATEIHQAFRLDSDQAEQRWGAPSVGFADSVMDQVLSETLETKTPILSLSSRRWAAAAALIMGVGAAVFLMSRDPSSNSGPSSGAVASLGGSTESPEEKTPLNVEPAGILSVDEVVASSGYYRVGGEPSPIELPADHLLVGLESLLVQSDSEIARETLGWADSKGQFGELDGVEEASPFPISGPSAAYVGQSHWGSSFDGASAPFASL